MNRWLFFFILWGSSASLNIDPLIINGRGSLTHMVLYNQSLFIGATNVIYQFNLELDLEDKIITGPRNDSQKCGINMEVCSALSELSPTDNHNKVLLLHSNKLIICGSLFQGKCEIRNVQNVSEVYFTGNTPVASNEMNVNTIAFITIVQNSATKKMETMIYVASEFTRFDKNSVEFNRRRSHPLVSIRLLDFSLRGKITYETESKYMKPGFMLYVTGFASGNYSYILFNEKVPEYTSYNSKLVHMCRRDDLLKTFLEIPLICIKSNKTFNILKTALIFKPGQSLLKSLQEQFPDLTSDDDVIIGLFGHSVDNSSALCLFSMPEVKKTILSNIKMCLNGRTEYAANSKYKNGFKCTRVDVSSFTDDELLCSNTLNLIIAGKTPVVATPVIQFPVTEDHPESLAVTITTEHTVSFIGTSGGRIKKVVLRTSGKAELYDSAIVVDEGHAIKQDMVFDDSQMYLYAMSDRKLAKIPVQNCTQYTTCGECLLSNDPYCGWCVLSHRCSLKIECYNPTRSRWVNGPSPEDNCLKIHSVSPPMVHVSQNISLNLTIIDLPRDYNSSYNCVFSFPNGDQRLSPARQWYSDIGCRNPNVDELRLFFNSDLGHINISLGIQSIETGQVIVSTPYLIYNCSSFISCTRCVDNVYWCDWCIRENKCQYNTQLCLEESVSSRNDTYRQTDMEYIGTESKQGKHFCPVVDIIQTGPLLISQDQSKRIIIQGKNFPEPDEYKGQIKLPSRTLNVEGRRISSTQLMFNISKIKDAIPKGLYEASMKVLWTEEGFIIENSYLILMLYNCTEQAGGDCTFCKNLELSQPAMNCRWCSDQCVDSLKNCPESLCPTPFVNSIDPVDGSVDGGTHITIHGKNVGVSTEQIDNITVAGVLCSNVSISGRNVLCVTGPSSVSSGPIIISVDGRVGVSPVMFTYKDPQLLGLYPAKVIQSGGRFIRLMGRNLLIGQRDIRVELIDEFSKAKLCSVKMEVSSDEAITCVPESTNSTGPHIIQVFFDKTSVGTLQNTRLTYLSDPVVQSTEPSELRSIYSGGLSFSVVGYGFVEVIDEMTVYFSGNKENKKDLCLRININRLNCKYPPFPSWMTENSSEVQTLQLSLDSFTTTLQPRVLYLKDPVFFQFNGNQSYSFDPASEENEIIIMGDCLDGVATKDDYFIRVGSGECIMTDLQTSNLTCKPPYTEPSPLSTDGKLYIRVQVGFLTVVVGDLIYSSATSVDIYIAIIVSITSVIVFAGAVALFAILRWRRLKTRKTQQRQNYVQNMQASGYEMLRRNGDKAEEHRIDESIVNLLKSKGLLISLDDLRIGDCVGKGNFGIVYEGTLTKLVDNYETKVAIKSLHQKESRDIDAKEFVNEALQMADFHHPNVMTLIGICLSDEMPLVILPFMRHGDMLTYIREQNNVMTLLNILQFGVDIARGMEYLSLQRVVHRDLAARNCMLGEDKTVVVADFGLSRDIYEKNYYCISNKKCKLPVKWMAPESLEKGIFTAQSDVWSFGVVMWELVTRGNKPYPEVDGWDMLKFLKMDRKLPQPQYCPDALYSVMTRCWDLIPDRRPTFSELVDELTGFTHPSPDENYLEPSFTYERLQSTYVNIGLGIDYSDLQQEN